MFNQKSLHNMLHMYCLRMLRVPRKCYRYIFAFFLSLPLSFMFLILFCPTIMRTIVLPYFCYAYRQNETSGALCEEFCSEPKQFTNIKCIDRIRPTFSAERNGNVYEFHFAKRHDEGLAWRDKNGYKIYPKSSDLQHMIKMHLLVNYNVTLEDNALKRLINQEIDENKPEQIQKFWWLFNNNNYLMTKLFEDDEIFPSLLGNCGPMYATEQLDIPFKSKSDRPHKHWNFKILYDYILHLEMIKPDPVKICHIELDHFGFSLADGRLKAVNADYIKLESQLHKQLASGKSCWFHSDCDWHYCRGRCHQGTCSEAPKHYNLQLLCDYVQIYRFQFEDLFLQPGMQQFYEKKCKRKFVRSRF